MPTHHQKFDREFNVVKEEMDGVSIYDKSPSVEDRLYMKVRDIYMHALMVI